MKSLDLFADGNDFSWETIEKNRNIYYQKQLANEILNQMNELISFLTLSLNIHLNIGQNILIDTSQVFMSLEIQSNLFSIRNGQVQLLSSNLNISNNKKISIRVCNLQ